MIHYFTLYSVILKVGKFALFLIINTEVGTSYEGVHENGRAYPLRRNI